VRVAAGLLILVALCIAAFVLAFVPGAGAPAARAQVNSNSVEDGRLLYVQNCASCHGNAGEGSSQANTQVPPLTNAGPAALDFYMRTGRMPLARLGLPAYEQPPTLTEDQIAAIIEYASAFSQGPEIPTVTDGTDLGRGWQMYVNNCAACHGAAGEGGSVGPGVTAPGLHNRDGTTIAEAMLIGPGAMPKFQFAQADADNIVSYIHSLDNAPAPGGFPLTGSGPVPEGLVAAIAGLGVMIVITRWVARREKLPDNERTTESGGTDS
jgi:ubiquinol-cytochrome c reductase cytochrome c subunit